MSTNEPNPTAIEAAITELQNENYDLGASDQYNSGLAIGIQTGYQKGYEAAKGTEWVKVSDGLPEKDDYYELTFRSPHDNARDIRKRFIDREFRENCRPEYIAWRKINDEPYTGE